MSEELTMLDLNKPCSTCNDKKRVYRDSGVDMIGWEAIPCPACQADKKVRHICCYSGGHSSALVAIEVVRRYGKDDVVLLNHDIASASEGEDIKRFKQEIADYLGLPVTYCNAVGWETKDQFDVVIEAGAFKVGNGTALCTNRMKTKPFELWLKENASLDDVIYYGFDAPEKLRMQRRSTHLGKLGYRTAYPIAHWARTIRSTEEIGITPPNAYEVFKHANCTGCLKAGRQHWYCVFCLRPDRWARGKEAEEEIGYTIIKGTSLEDLEPLFMQMKELGIQPTEHIQAATFWAGVKKLIKSVAVDEEVILPCECTV